MSARLRRGGRDADETIRISNRLLVRRRRRRTPANSPARRLARLCERGACSIVSHPSGQGADPFSRAAAAIVTPPGPEQLADIADLSARLRFCPKDGRIWLDDQRMLLIHLAALANLRKELIAALGAPAARGLLTRMGYASGIKDAELARRLRPKDDLHAFNAGPQLHALEGMVSVEAVRVEADVATGHHYGEFIWRGSAEVDAHVAAFGMAAEPVCWMQIGYASGYTSVFMGRPILYREVECRGAGARHCRIVGKPVEEWDDPNPDLVYLQPQSFASLVTREQPASLAPAAPTILRSGRDETDAADPESGLVGVSSGFRAAHQLLRKVARTNATVLFLGETGVGKEMFARALHRLSPRVSRPFIGVNCAAIPENLVESELFGVERGAFTGAVASRPGRFERADGGSLFLDEIGSINLAAQGKLLRALQEREIERVGGVDVRRVDVRVIAATNVDLREAARTGGFREDLFFRLNVFPIRIPPLRERRDDVPPLARLFLAKYAQRYAKPVTRFADRALDRLRDYHFPGNVRELENIIERAVILAPDDGGLIDAEHLFAGGEEMPAPYLGLSRDGSLTDGGDAGAGGMGGAEPPADDAVIAAILARNLPLERVETLLIDAAVARADGNLAEAARCLGLTRPQLAYRYKRLKDE